MSLWREQPCLSWTTDTKWLGNTRGFWQTKEIFLRSTYLFNNCFQYLLQYFHYFFSEQTISLVVDEITTTPLEFCRKWVPSRRGEQPWHLPCINTSSLLQQMKMRMLNCSPFSTCAKSSTDSHDLNVSFVGPIGQLINWNDSFSDKLVN